MAWRARVRTAAKYIAVRSVCRRCGTGSFSCTPPPGKPFPTSRRPPSFFLTMDECEPMDSGSIPSDAVRVLLTGFGVSAFALA